MKKIQNEVRRILIDAPMTRDNDKLLTINYWMTELGLKHNKYLKTFEFMEFCILYSTDKLTDAQTITRARRQLQMKEPQLRGEKYKARMANQEKVKEDLGYKVN